MPYDHQRFYDVRDQRDVVIGAVKKELGIHLSADHPSGKDPLWILLHLVDSIEVWNSAVWPKNANAMMIWGDMLSSGRHLTGRGGSDEHHGTPDSVEKATKNSVQRVSNYVGTPTTWVFTKEKTRQTVIDALDNGRVSVSANPYGPRVEFLADLNNDGTMDMMMGDDARTTGMPVGFRVQLSGKTIPGGEYTVHIVKNGDPLEDHAHDLGRKRRHPARRLYRYTLHDHTDVLSCRSHRPQTSYPEVPGSMKFSADEVGLSNPIYFNFNPNF